jgi:hypothetical protein
MQALTLKHAHACEWPSVRLVFSLSPPQFLSFSFLLIFLTSFLFSFPFLSFPFFNASSYFSVLLSLCLSTYLCTYMPLAFSPCFFF